MNPKLRAVVFSLAIAVLSALVVLTSGGQESRSKEQQSAFQRSFTVAPGTTLAVENYKGTIHVTGTDGNQAVVDVRKKFEGSDSDRKWWMENVKIDFNNGPGRLQVKVEYPNRNCTFCFGTHDYTASVELELRVPRQTNLRIDSYKPDIRISGLKGDISVKSYKSPILIESTTGAIRVLTYKETVQLRDVTVRGRLWVKSYKADTEVSATSLGESAYLENYKGSILLRVPASTGLDVDFEGGRRSSFSSDFALTSSNGYAGREVRGTVNHGGTALRLRTDKGSVELRKISGEL